jgi:hypothetical protein
VVSVGHEPESLATVRGADARSAQISRPDGVARSFQVSENSVEPPKPVRARNLFAKDDWRPALVNELEPGGPEVALVVEPSSPTGCAERLAGAAPGPHVGVVGDASEAQGVAPSGDPGEEMPLSRPANVSC